MDLNKRADSLEEFGTKVEDDDEVGSSANHFLRKLDERIRQNVETVGTSQNQNGLSSELEIQKSNGSDFALLKSKYKVLEDQKASLEKEVIMLRIRNSELEEKIASSEDENRKVGIKEEDAIGSSWKSKTSDATIEIDEESKVNQLIVENDVLRCEKKVAEMEAAKWKQKCCELESRLLQEITSVDDAETNKVNPLHGLVIKGEHGVPQSGHVNACRDSETEITPVKPARDPLNVSNNDSEVISLSCGKKKLSFVDTRKKVAPSTPAATMPDSNRIIDLVDSDEEQGAPLTASAVSTPLKPSSATSRDVKLLKAPPAGITVEDDNEEDMSGPIQFLATPKRKRALKLVTSDSEAEDDDDDDDVPISQVLKKNSSQHATAQNNSPETKLAEPCPGTEFGDDGSSRITSRRRRLMKISALEERLGTQQTDFQSKTAAAGMNVDSDDADEVEMEGEVSPNHVKRGRNVDGGNFKSPTRRSQRLLKKSEERNRHQLRTPPPDDDDTEDDDIDSDDDDGLKDFIVDDDDANMECCGDEVDNDDHDAGGNSVPDADDDDNGSESGGSGSGSGGENVNGVSSDSELDLDEILDRIKRGSGGGGKRKDQAPMKWEMFGDMLAAFGQDVEVCMKAVCAMCRRQTNDEQRHDEALVANGRGFSKFDAARGTKLAKFLTNGDLDGDVRKSVDELKRYDPDGPEQCRTLAIRYSKQLFDIYCNEEDAYFRPPK